MLPLLLLVYLGGYALMAACIVVSFIGVREFYKGYEAAGTKPAYGLAYAGNRVPVCGGTDCAE